MWSGTHTGLGWLGWTLMTVGMVAFWGAVIWAIFAMTRSGRAGGRGVVPHPDEILAGRFARGEMSTEEYVQARSLLDNGPEQPNADTSEEVV